MMEFLPVGLRIKGKRILIVGGGRVAAQKARSLRRFTGRLTVVAEKVSEEVRRTGARCREKPYAPQDLDGVFLVYACTDSKRVNARIRGDARRRGILVSVADDPALCDIISPAIFKKGRMTVAVSSDGRDARSSVTLRDKIKDLI
ncbi:MAG: precorrin-2 dehydrogenase/sirohydrochlorin ferrochelatase family protein [Endomicrobiales bacterium]